MRSNKFISFAAACLGMVLLILDSRTALKGAQEGVTLAVTVLVPSLFPFLFLSIWLTNTLNGIFFSGLKPLGRLFHIPEGSEALILTAFLGGYPAGAQAVAQAYRSGLLSKENSEKMLAFCNNAGPSFLLGMAAACFSEKWMLWALWLFHILGALIAARIHPCSLQKSSGSSPCVSFSLTYILRQALYVMALICGWVILFRVLIAFADRWFLWMLSSEARTGIIGLLELSNGICELDTVANEKVRFMICSVILSLGGLCVTLQTHSVTEGLSKAYFYRGKLIQAVVSLCCSAALMYHAVFLIPLISLIPFLLPKNRCRNPETVGV